MGGQPPFGSFFRFNAWGGGASIADVRQNMRFYKAALCLLASLLLQSCAIYLDEPKTQSFSGRLLRPDGTPASDTLVTVSSARDYIPLMLALAPHQPIMLFSDSRTDKKGLYSIDAQVSLQPMISALIPGEEGESPTAMAFAPAEDGQTLRMVTWEDHLVERRKQGEQAVAPNRSLAPTLKSTSSVRGSED
jgi:hypothetical protein